MEYRRLGRTGLRVSALSYGTWATFDGDGDLDTAIAQLALARAAGINCFDTADGYGAGAAESLLGAALQRVRWDRATYVLTTKLFTGVRACVNMRQTLNRKYLRCAIDESLDRLQTSFVDLLYCHRPDPDTDLEEVVWTMSELVSAGKAHYWGTSEWPVDQIHAAWQIADRRHLRPPLLEQRELHVFERTKVDGEFAVLQDELGIGLTTWSPLASGLLTGKYRDGAPAGSRGARPDYRWLQPALVDAARNRRVAALAALAAEIGATPAQLAIAWCTTYRNVASVILGARTTEQLAENLGAAAVVPKLTAGVLARIRSI